GALADPVRIGLVEPSFRLGVLDVALRRQAAADQVTRSLRKKVMKLLLVEFVAAGAADAGRHVAEQVLDKRAQVWLDFAVEQVRAHQAGAAGYVGSHRARGNHPS